MVWEERTLIKRMPPSYCPVGKSLRHFLNNDRCDRVQPAEGDAGPVQEVMNCVRKEVEKAMAGK